ncbi:MAG: hypothetical protein NTW03_03660 [Verrucomicrobia bacterium]|nr:hypothetical protein [Verrucomicrobiota bacterium]
MASIIPGPNPPRAPGPPDLATNADAACIEKLPEIYRFNANYEKNSDYCAKAVAAICVNPLSPGTLDYNWRRDGGDFFSKGKIVVFGALK